MKLITPNRCSRMLIKLFLLCGMGLTSACVEHSSSQYVPGYYSTNTYPSYQGTRYHHNHYRNNDYYSSKSGTRNNYPPAPDNGGYYSSGSNGSRVHSNRPSTTPSDDGYYSSKDSQSSNGESNYSSSR